MNDRETPHGFDPAELGGEPACWAHLLDADGDPVIDADGDPVIDADGDPVLDADGDQVIDDAAYETKDRLGPFGPGQR